MSLKVTKVTFQEGKEEEGVASINWALLVGSESVEPSYAASPLFYANPSHLLM